MAKVRCLDCPAAGEWGRAGRCPEHRLQRQRLKDQTPRRRAQKRKYDSAHQRKRAALRPAVEAGTIRCWRCNQWIAIGENWHLGHKPDGSSAPEHVGCNLQHSNENRGAP